MLYHHVQNTDLTALFLLLFQMSWSLSSQSSKTI